MFKNKVIWITGAGTGLGKALAIELGRQGAHIVLTGRRKNRLEEVAEILNKQGTKNLVVDIDVTDSAGLERAVSETITQFGQLDIVIANAGYSVNGRFDKLGMSDWRKQFDVNVFGLVETVQVALPELRKTKGQIVLMGSVMAFYGLPTGGAYSASKAAVRSIGQSLNAELRREGIYTTVIEPGFVESEIYQVTNQQKVDLARKDARPPRLMWKADRAARVMAKAIACKKSDFVFTGHGRFAVFFMQHFPRLVNLLMGSRFAQGRANKFHDTRAGVGA